MRTSWIKFAGVASVVAFVAIILRLLISSNEDTWLCVNGSWVRHGNPIDAAPTTPCGYVNP